jgi:arginyl-tRNA synthetase
LNQTIISLLKEKFIQALFQAFPNQSQCIDSDLIEITRSTQDRFGHYQCNAAMKLSKNLKLNPREIAQALLDSFDQSSMIKKFEIAGPGFINITLSTSFLENRLSQLLSDPKLGIVQELSPKKILIDYSSPNVAKEMHVGHLRSTIIGESLARLFTEKGNEVLRINHIGDWGTAFGMLITHLKDMHPEVVEDGSTCSLQELVEWYRDSKERFDQDPEFKKRSQLEVVSLQSGEPKALEAWKTICEISRRAYQEIYEILDTTLQERGESFYNPYLGDLVRDLEDKGLLEISDGAKCIYLEGYTNREGNPLPLMVQKSDGGYNYASTDLAAIRYRFTEDKIDRAIYVTDAGQATHFKMVFEAAQKAGYWNKGQHELNHVPFGLVLRADGKKFRTRSGETERLYDLLINAVKKSEQLLKERGFEGENLEETAQVLGLGAVKYADLSCHRTGDYIFSYDKMLSFEGNTAAFLMYAYVRVQGIYRKTNKDINKLKQDSKISLIHSSEITLGVHLSQFSEAIEHAIKDLIPNRICEYLFGLAEKFNSFFRDCRVEGVEEEESRLLLCDLTAQVLKKGLFLLGIKIVNKM